MEKVKWDFPLYFSRGYFKGKIQSYKIDITMKNSMRYVLLLAVVLFTNTVNAKLLPMSYFDKTEVTVSAVKKVLSVRISDAENTDATISIQNTEGVEIFTESLVGKAASLRKYNLQKLEIGQYTLIVKRKRSKLIQPFSVNIENIDVQMATRETLYTPTVVLKDRKLDVSAVSFGKPGISLTITDNLGTIVFEEKSNIAILQKRYNLSKLPNGAYIVEVVTYGTETEYFPISIQ